MNELIEALERLLERGIVVEPVTLDWGATSQRQVLRVRLDDVEEPEQVALGIAGEITRAW